MRIISTLILSIFSSLYLFAQTATVTLTTEKQVIQGFGGMNLPEWVGDLTAAQRETAFGTGTGQLGMSILRIFISDNSSDWSKGVATAKAAQAKGNLIFASPWNPPSSMTELFTKSGDADAKRLKYDSYAAYAQHLIDYITYMKGQGVKIYAISIQNEPDWGSEWTWWTATEIYNFAKNNVPAIRTAHPDVKIIAAESFGYSKGMTDPILNDAAVLANIDIVGVHTYGVTYPSAYPLLKSKSEKEFWMTEVYHPNSNDNSADVWPEALEVGHHIHRCMVDAEMQAYVWWYIRRQYSPMKEDGTMSKRGACFAQFSRFVRPGFVRIDVPQNPTTDVYVSAYKKTDSVTIVLLNKSTSSKTLTISIPGTKALSWDRWITSETKNVAKGTDLYSGSSILLTLEPQSMTTLVSVNTPKLITANPENASFDLPLATDSFEFTYTTPVNCTLAKASMTGNGQTFDLVLRQTGFSNKLTFKVPVDKTLAYGDYTITVSGIASEQSLLSGTDDVVNLTYNVPESAGTIETIVDAQASWVAQQTTIQEGIPLGWKRIQGSTNIDVDANGAVNTTGSSRMKYFATGGDFAAGFYFSARGEDLCRLIYGEFDGYRVHLKPGNYKASFNSAYWDASSQTAGVTFSFFVKDLQSNTVFTKSALPSLTSLNSTAGGVVTGSKLHEITFSIPEENDYLLQWNIANGWNAVILGAVKLQTAATAAMEYKDKLAKALTAANALYTSTDTVLYRGTIRTALLSTIQSYNNFASTAPSAYTTAIETIGAASALLNSHMSKVNTYLSTLSSAKASIEKYNNTANLAALPALNGLIQTVATYDNLASYDDETVLTLANTNLTSASDKLKAQMDLLKYRINKGITLAKSLKTPVPASELVAAEAVAIDDDVVANALNVKIKEYIESNIANKTFVFKADTNVTVTNMVDSLDLTNYIKNPNFYTRTKTTLFENGTFPGWSNTSFSGLSDVSLQPLATDADPIVDSYVCMLNTQIDYFEQLISNMPAGVYDIGFKVRRASGTVTQQQLLDNIYMYVKYGATTLKQPLTMVSTRALPAAVNTWIQNVKIASGVSLTLGIKFIPVSGYEPTVFFGDPVIFMIGKNKDVTYTAVTNVTTDDQVKEVQYFTTLGQRITQPVKGLNIIKTIYANGRIETEKVLVK
jgi:O-glycosyl hydrolase